MAVDNRESRPTPALSEVAGDERSNVPVEWDKASFRDPAGFVFTSGGRVFRGIRESFQEEWDRFFASPLFLQLQQAELLIPTMPAVAGDLPGRVIEQCGSVVEHPRVPFVSYPYEWSFEMLRDAALLHLEILERCLPCDIILKDASPFNVQFLGSRPIFIDVLSFCRLERGEPWLAYAQFCRMLLYPLLLRAYRGIRFQSQLRSELEGLDAADTWAMLGLRSLGRAGVFRHVWLQALMQRRLASAPYSVREHVRSAGLPKQAIINNMRALHRLISGLRPRRHASPWTAYDQIRKDDDAAIREKGSFVGSALERQQPRLVWDLGCNTGRFARLASASAEYVVAMDQDESCIDQLYRTSNQRGDRKILPLVINVANPSPEQGWSGERQALIARGKPDLILCLALTHHLRVSANIPLESLVHWLHAQASSLVIEFVSKDDSMTRLLLRNKNDTYDDYEVKHFEDCLARHFSIGSRMVLSGGTRFLYHALPRN